MIKIIVVGPDARILEIIKYVVEFHLEAETVLSSTFEGLESSLSNNPGALCAVVDSYLALGAWTDFSKVLSERCPTLPLVFFGDPCANESVAELSSQFKNPISGFIEIPHFIDPLVNLLKGLCRQGQAVDASSSGAYIPVSCDILRVLKKVPVKMFIRLAPENFIQVLAQGDALDRSPLEALKKNPSGLLYVRRPDAARLAKAFESWLLKGDQRAPAFDPGRDFPLSVSAFCTLQGLFKALWFSAEVQSATRAAVSRVMEQLDSEPNIKPLMRLLAEKHESYVASHSMVIAYLSCAFGRALGWNSEFTFRKLILASLLHDIVIERDDIAQVRSADDLVRLRLQGRKDDASIAENHPFLAAELVRSMRDYPLGADLVVAQHHDLPDGTGFPHQISALKIEPLSAMFILLHDFVDRVLGMSDRESYLHALDEMEEAYRSQPFGPLLKAFRSMIESRDP